LNKINNKNLKNKNNLHLKVK